MKRINFFIQPCIVVALIFSTVIFSSCKKDNSPTVPAGPDVTFYALTQDNRLLSFNGMNTSVSLSNVSITGMQSGETMAGIDFRPNTGELFGVGTSSRLYKINIQSGIATAIGTTPFTPAISGSPLGFDFNPTVDRIRLVTATGQNLRLNPETGAVAAVDGTINGATASITGVAYTQNRAGATSTVLYDIDITSNKLYKQLPPNAGTLVEVGSLGVDAESASGFDISPDSAYALAALTVSGKSGLYTINLVTGAATNVGSFSSQIISLAIPTIPQAYAISNTNALIILNPTTGNISFTKPITGLQTGEDILGLDMRPATGQLYALGSSSRLYAINVSSGAATQIGSGTLTTLLLGTDFGFDFNPTVDRIRVVSNLGQNLRLNPIDGSVSAIDGNINPATYMVSASAYTNNFAGATTTTLFGIDATVDKLLQQTPPNNGTIVEVGSLGVNIESANGFDISSVGGIGYAIFTSNSVTNLYTINLTTGAAKAGPAFSQPVRGFTLGIGL
ncbi:MAG: DUF4394 domain-containing protein [Ferruginibacter sp.]